MQCNIDMSRKTGICDDTEDCETSMTLRGEGLRTNTSRAGSKPLFDIVCQRERHYPAQSTPVGRGNDCHLSSLWFALGSVAQPPTTNGDYIGGHTDLYIKIEPSGPRSRLKNSSVSEMLAK